MIKSKIKVWSIFVSQWSPCQWEYMHFPPLKKTFKNMLCNFNLSLSILSMKYYKIHIYINLTETKVNENQHNCNYGHNSCFIYYVTN